MASIVQRKSHYYVVYMYRNNKGENKQNWETYHTLVEAKRRKAEVEYHHAIGKPYVT